MIALQYYSILYCIHFVNRWNTKLSNCIVSEFVIAPTQGGEYVESTSGDSVVLSVYVSVDGSWDEVRVEVITPTSTEEVTDYDTEILQNRREYKYTISNPSYSDLGNYTFIATDKYQYNIMQTTYLYGKFDQIFTYTTF